MIFAFLWDLVVLRLFNSRSFPLRFWFIGSKQRVSGLKYIMRNKPSARKIETEMLSISQKIKLDYIVFSSLAEASLLVVTELRSNIFERLCNVLVSSRCNSFDIISRDPPLCLIPSDQMWNWGRSRDFQSLHATNFIGSAGKTWTKTPATTENGLGKFNYYLIEFILNNWN